MLKVIILWDQNCKDLGVVPNDLGLIDVFPIWRFLLLKFWYVEEENGKIYKNNVAWPWLLKYNQVFNVRNRPNGHIFQQKTIRWVVHQQKKEKLNNPIYYSPFGPQK